MQRQVRGLVQVRELVQARALVPRVHVQARAWALLPVPARVLALLHAVQVQVLLVVQQVRALPLGPLLDGFWRLAPERLLLAVHAREAELRLRRDRE